MQRLKRRLIRAKSSKVTTGNGSVLEVDYESTLAGADEKTLQNVNATGNDREGARDPESKGLEVEPECNDPVSPDRESRKLPLEEGHDVHSELPTSELEILSQRFEDNKKQLESRLRDLEFQVREERGKTHDLERGRDHLIEELKGRDSSIENLSRRLDEANHRFETRMNDIESEYKRQQSEIESQRDDLAAKVIARDSQIGILERRLQEANSLLEEQKREPKPKIRRPQRRPRELGSACDGITEQKTMTLREDTLSAEDILLTIGDLNAELVNLASHIADSVKPQSRSMHNDHTHHRGAHGLMDDKFFPLVEALLTKRDHSKDPTALQFVIQAIFTSWLNTIFTSFCFGLPAEMDHMLQEVYVTLIERDQMEATYWRSLTHSCLARSLRPTPRNVASDVMKWIAMATSLSGCTGNDIIPESLNTQFGPRVISMVETAFGLVDVFKEKASSAEFNVIVPCYDDVFDPEDMEDVFASTSSDRKVMITLEVGLTCRKKMLKSQGTPIEGFHDRFRLKPKVVLDSVFQTLLPA